MRGFSSTFKWPCDGFVTYISGRSREVVRESLHLQLIQSRVCHLRKNGFQFKRLTDNLWRFGHSVTDIKVQLSSINQVWQDLIWWPSSAERHQLYELSHRTIFIFHLTIFYLFIFCFWMCPYWWAGNIRHLRPSTHFLYVLLHSCDLFGATVAESLRMLSF